MNLCLSYMKYFHRDFLKGNYFWMMNAVCIVFLSLCHHRGVIVLGNETHVLEPVPRSPTNDHLLYLLKDVRSEPFLCGVVSEDDENGTLAHSHERFHPGQTMSSLLRVRIVAT